MTSKRGKVKRVKFFTRQDIQADTQTYYLFGDNMQEKGLGGQAKAARGEMNVIGIPTKWKPDDQESSFFKDEDLLNPLVLMKIDLSFEYAEVLLSLGCDIVISADGIGTGLADLPNRAPKIFAYINAKIKQLEGIKLT